MLKHLNSTLYPAESGKQIIQLGAFNKACTLSLWTTA